VVFSYLFYDMNKDAAPRNFEKKFAFKATHVISEIIKSADRDLIDKLCVIDNNLANSGHLYTIWNTSFLPMPELELLPIQEIEKDKEVDPAIEAEYRAAMTQNNKVRERMSDASFYTCKILRKFLTNPDTPTVAAPTSTPKPGSKYYVASDGSTFKGLYGSLEIPQ
jgi:hypothetical protein